MANADLSLTPALKGNPKYIFFTDFDGTITNEDSNDWMFNHLGLGPALRDKAFEDVLRGRRTFRDMFKEQMDHVTKPFNETLDLLRQNITLDAGFKEFLKWAKDNNIPVIVLSGGMEPVVRGLLGHLVGEETLKGLQVVSSYQGVRAGKKTVDEEAGWEIVYRDESEHGHDKSRTIRPYASLPKEKRPVLFYAGDGVSDLSAARETDLLFAKAGRDLVWYCDKEKVPYRTFENYSEILNIMKDIVAGKISLEKAGKGKVVAN